MSILYSHPIQGHVQPITETPDEIFSLKLLGDGFVVVPKSSTITSPINGFIDTIYASKHIIIIKNNTFHVMIHLGLKLRESIVEWNVKAQDKVNIGDPIGQILPNFFQQSELEQSCNIVFLEKQTCHYQDHYITCEDK